MKKDSISLVCVPPWHPRFVPLGVAYLAEYLRSRGFAPDIVDFNVQLYRSCGRNSRFWDIGNLNFTFPHRMADELCAAFKPEIEALVGRLLDSGSHTIGFSTTIASIGLAARLSSFIKKRDKSRRTVIGGTGCFWPTNRQIIDHRDLPSVDAFVIGEGEEPLEAILTRDSLDGIPGVLSKKSDFLGECAGHWTADLGSIPFPTFSGFDLSAYVDRRVIPLLFSRGCIGRCSFCIDHLMCGRFRWREPRSIVDEMKYHVEHNGIREFTLNDLLCNGNLRQLEAVCDLIRAEKLHVFWGGYAMIRKEMTAGLLKKMRGAGCGFLCYGGESGCDRTLAAMNKLYRSADAERVIRESHEAGIKTSVNVIAGFPRETEEDFRETVSWVARNAPFLTEVTNVSTFVSMAGSAVGKDPAAHGIVSGISTLTVDENGTDLAARVRRVRRMVYQMALLDVKSAVINEPGLTRPASPRIALVRVPPREPGLAPAGLCRLLSGLAKRRIETFIFDLNARLLASCGERPGRYWSEDAWMWGSRQTPMVRDPGMFERVFAQVDDLLSREPAVVFLDIDEGSAQGAAWLCRLLKKYRPGTVVAAEGSFLPSLWAERVLEATGADLVLYGGHEEALARLARDPLSPLEGIPHVRVCDGVCVRGRGKVTETGFRRVPVPKEYMKGAVQLRWRKAGPDDEG